MVKTRPMDTGPTTKINMNNLRKDFLADRSMLPTDENQELAKTLSATMTKSLTIEEKKYLLAVERGDLANVKRMLQRAHKYNIFNPNCVDSLGRSALTLAIDGENLEMLELLVIMGVETKDALLHAISVEFVEAVELLLEHEEIIHRKQDKYSWQTVDKHIATFTPDITPLVLAAHRNNYEILKLLLDRGATLPMPHDIKCGCEECIRDTGEDSLRHSLSRVNEYKALASPSLIALSSSDPILTSFQLSWELRNLSFAEPECKAEYMELRQQCQQFAVDLLQQSRSSQELAIILNHDPTNPTYEYGDRMRLARLKLAIQYKQKKFVAHPHIQQLLASIWYEGVPGFRRKSLVTKMLLVARVALLFPFYCLLYLVAPNTTYGRVMKKPFMKFLIHASSYLFFLLVLSLVSQRAEYELVEYFGTDEMKRNNEERYRKHRGNTPTFLEYIIIIYVIGFIFEETNEIYVVGIRSYLRNLWNVIDFIRNLLYCVVFVLRVAAYIQQTGEIRQDSGKAYVPREEWHDYDPQLIAEGLFAAANIFSALKLIHLFSIDPHLGPLQISLGRMIIDIIKFLFIYGLVLFAFACGLNQLLWYFSDLERKKCFNTDGQPDWIEQGESCSKWRGFIKVVTFLLDLLWSTYVAITFLLSFVLLIISNVFESSQSLFWASFGMININNFELEGIKSYTRFWGLLMFGSYSVINIIVLLNLLIAMMSNSYAIIDCHSDTEWKFARTKLWISYFDETPTLPPPFNIIPHPKWFFRLCGYCNAFSYRDKNKKYSQDPIIKEQARHTNVMRALVWRYVTSMHRKCEESLVTEDDVNEVKNDISAFRYEMLEILNRNGMDVSCAEKKEKCSSGKKMKIWERRLMKDFKVAPVTPMPSEEEILTESDSGKKAEDSLSRFRRCAKLALLQSNLNKWKATVAGATNNQIGSCFHPQSIKKQKNIARAMEEARKLVESKQFAAIPVPIELPDTTCEGILKLVQLESITPLSTPVKKIKSPKKFLRSVSPLFEPLPNETDPQNPHKKQGNYLNDNELVRGIPDNDNNSYKSHDYTLNSDIPIIATDTDRENNKIKSKLLREKFFRVLASTESDEFTSGTSINSDVGNNNRKVPILQKDDTDERDTMESDNDSFLRTESKTEEENTETADSLSKNSDEGSLTYTTSFTHRQSRKTLNASQLNQLDGKWV